MPYASKDRQEFIKRLSLKPESRVLDIGGMLCNELPSAVFGITAPRPLTNAILIKPALLPFKNYAFDAVVSYHYLDLIPSGILGYVFEETARVLNKNSSFSFMITLWAPQNEAQRSNLYFNELLKSTGALFNHDVEEISKQLSSAGFSEITVESIKRDITIPREYVRAHLIMLGNLVKKEKAEGGTGIKALAKKYFAYVKEHGEAMLPALHFNARKL